MAKNDRQDIYSEVTQDIIKSLEEDLPAWQRSWSGMPISFPLRVTSEPYQGINIIILWLKSHLCGYSSPYWMTFKQAKQLGGNVRKAQKASRSVYSATYTRAGDNAENDDADDKKQFRFLKSYAVFNANQIDGLPSKFYPKIDQTPINEDQRTASLDAFFSGIDIDFSHQPGTPHYNWEKDTIAIPSFEQFFNAEAYYSTRGHEYVHATGHKDRLDRNFGAKDFKKSDLAFEELIAEIGSAFLNVSLGFAPQASTDHKSYIAHWITLLKNNDRAIFQAASKAQSAVDWLYQNSKVT